MAEFDYVSNAQLQLTRNTSRWHGVMSVGLGLCLFVVAGGAAWGAVDGFATGTTQELLRRPWDLSREQIGGFLKAIAGVLVVFGAIRYLVTGLLWMRGFVPIRGVPGSLGNAAELTDCLRAGKWVSQPPSKLVMFRRWVSFGAMSMAMTQAKRAVCNQLLRICERSLKLCVLIAVAYIIIQIDWVALLAEHTAKNEDFKRLLAAAGNVPFPGWLAGLAGTVAFASLAAVISLLPRRIPREQVLREQERLAGECRPQMLVDHFKQAAQSVSRDGQPNREAELRYAASDQVGAGDSENFARLIVIEQQPRAVATSGRATGISLSALGSILVLVGSWILCKRAELVVTDVVVSGLALVAGLYAMLQGGSLRGLGHALLEIRGYEALVVAADLRGSVRKSTYTVGASMTSQARSENEITTVDATVTYHAARCATESIGAAGDRTLVEMWIDGSTATDVRSVHSDLATRLHSPVKAVAIDFADRGAESIMKVNLAFQQVRPGDGLGLLQGAGPVASLPSSSEQAPSTPQPEQDTTAEIEAIKLQAQARNWIQQRLTGLEGKPMTSSLIEAKSNFEAADHLITRERWAAASQLYREVLDALRESPAS